MEEAAFSGTSDQTAVIYRPEIVLCIFGWGPHVCHRRRQFFSGWACAKKEKENKTRNSIAVDASCHLAWVLLHDCPHRWTLDNDQWQSGGSHTGTRKYMYSIPFEFEIATKMCSMRINVRKEWQQKESSNTENRLRSHVPTAKRQARPFRFASTDAIVYTTKQFREMFKIHSAYFVWRTLHALCSGLIYIERMHMVKLAATRSRRKICIADHLPIVHCSSIRSHLRFEFYVRRPLPMPTTTAKCQQDNDNSVCDILRRLKCYGAHSKINGFEEIDVVVVDFV